MSKTQKTTTTISARALDKFYTSPACVTFCLEALHKTVGPAVLDQHDLWIEPSAGAGAFLSHLPPSRIGIDLAPEHPEVLRADFLHWRPDASVKSPIVIGNPPFRKNASLAIRFFNHASTFASRIAFIVPRSFEKESVQVRLDPAFHLEAQVELSPESFLFEGKPYAVPTVWQVWVRRDQPRSTVRSAITCHDFAFCKPEEADFAIQRVGANAGRIKLDAANKSENSHTFVRATGMPVKDLLAWFRLIDFDTVKHATSGNPSISNREIVALYTDLFPPIPLAA